MIDAPLLTAEDILIDAIKAALTPYAGSFNGRAKVYYQQAEQGAPLPFVIFQFQTDIGRLDWVGMTGATGLITVKALAAYPGAARTLLATTAPGMASLRAAGYTLTVRYERSPTLPPVTGVWQALHVYRFVLERA